MNLGRSTLSILLLVTFGAGCSGTADGSSAPTSTPATSTGDTADGTGPATSTGPAATEATGSTSASSDPAAPGTSAFADGTTGGSPGTLPDRNQGPAGPPSSDEPSGPPSTLSGPRSTADATPQDPVPIGEVVEVPGLWDLAVTSVDLDAAPEVREFASINPNPAPGFRYVLIGIKGVYLGDQVAQPVFEWAVSDGTTEYRPSIPGCGVIPDSIYNVVEVVPGQSFVANLCLPVSDTSVAAGLQLFLQPVGDKAWYFDLQ